jgi:hypothetical protein
VAVLDQTLDPVPNLVRLVPGSFSYENLDRTLFGWRTGCSQFLLGPIAELVDKVRGECHNLRTAAVIGPERYSSGSLETFRKLREKREVAPAPLVDRLIVVAHHGDRRSEIDQPLEQFVLGAVEILALVHENVPYAPLEPLVQQPPFVKRLHGLANHEAERDQTHLSQKPLVAFENSGEGGSFLLQNGA